MGKAMTGTDVARVKLSREDAARLTAEVREDVRSLWIKVLDLFEGGAHIALGYGNWGAYWEGEFGQSGARGEQLVRAGRVVRALEAADVPLPANDLVARALIPVIRTSPDDLVGVWSRAVEAGNGKPTAKQVREFVQPYRDSWERGRPGDPDSWKRRGATRRKRNLAAIPLANAHVNAVNAHVNIDDALTAEPTSEMLIEWLTYADAGAKALEDVAERIRAHRG